MLVFVCLKSIVECESDGIPESTILDKRLLNEQTVGFVSYWDIVRLNVGGAHFVTLKTTLTQKIPRPNGGVYAPNLLEQIMTGQAKMTLDENGAIFIDREPGYFTYVLGYLRSLSINKPFELPDLTAKETRVLFEDAEYYNLQSLLDLYSSVISPKDLIKLNPAFGFTIDQKWRLIYRGSVDGFGAADFHRHCDGIANTITVVKSSNGNIFGGYTNAAWDSSNDWKADSGAFLFSLQKKLTLKIFKCIRCHYSIICNRHSGPNFFNDLYIADNSNLNLNSFSNLGDAYESPAGYKYNREGAKSLLAGSYNFLVTEIEIFTKL
jgi:hypothetical protein